jgi:hypothetical protein
MTALKGETEVGQKASLFPTSEYEGEAAGLITPMVWRDTYEAFKEEGMLQGVGTGAAAFFGVGTQTYTKKKSSKGKSKKSYMLRNIK